jgi:hypothetical protein
MDFKVIVKQVVYCGIDNGKSGALVFINDKEDIISKFEMPVAGIKREYDMSIINQILNKYNNDYNLKVFLEDCHTMPKNGSKQNFKIGEQFGLLKGLLYANKITYEIIKARDWQKELLKSMTVKDTKTKAIQYCIQKYPNEDFRRNNKCKNIYDGYTDATCLAIFGKRKLK